MFCLNIKQCRLQCNPLLSTFYLSSFSNSQIFSSLMNFFYIHIKICPFSCIRIKRWSCMLFILEMCRRLQNFLFFFYISNSFRDTPCRVSEQLELGLFAMQKLRTIHQKWTISGTAEDKLQIIQLKLLCLLKQI